MHILSGIRGLFVGMLLFPAVLNAAQFEKAVVSGNTAFADGEAHEITFKKSDGTPFEDFEPGDLIALRMSRLKMQNHLPHVYAVSYFNKSGSLLKIIIDPQYRFGQPALPAQFQTISAQLKDAKDGDKTYRIKVLKAGIQSEFFTSPILMIGFGNAITRQLGILRYIEEDFESGKYKSPIWVSHSISYDQPHYLKDEFKRISEGSLKGLFRYIPYETGQKIKIPRMQVLVPPVVSVSSGSSVSSSRQTTSYLDRLMNQFSLDLNELAEQESQDQTSQKWGLLVTAHDAGYDKLSSIEEEIYGHISDRMQANLPSPYPGLIYSSKWSRTGLGDFISGGF